MSKYSLTILRAPKGQILTKIYEPDGSITGYSQVSKIRSVESVRVKTLESLRETLEYLSDRPDKCVIRGELRDDRPAGSIRRRKTYFDDTPRSWVMIDIDRLRTPEKTSLTERAIFARAALPAEFHGVRCVWQASASAQKLSKKVKLHLWFLLDRPATSAGLRSWLSDIDPIDPIVFRSVQPHYTAAPINGPDIKQRVGLLDGPIDRVPVPANIDLAPVEYTQQVDIIARAGGLRDVTQKQIRTAARRTDQHIEKLIAECSIAYRDSYTAGCMLGNSLAWSTWNDLEAHENAFDSVVADTIDQLAVRFAALPKTKHEARVYASRIREGVHWGFAQTREYLTRTQVNDARRAEQLEAAAERAKEQLKKSIKLLRENPKALASEAEKLGRFTGATVLDREAVVRELRIESGASEQDVEAALSHGELSPLDLDAWRAGLKVSGKYGEVIAGNEYNITMILRNHHECMNALRWNNRSLCYEVTRDVPWSNDDVPRKLEPREIGSIVLWLGTLGCRDASSKTVYSALENLVGQVLHYDPFIEVLNVKHIKSAEQALEELEQLGPRKLDTWLVDHFDAVGDREYLRAVGSKTLISAVARAFDPGAQVDTVMVLAGAQGYRKTSACRALGSVVSGGFRTLNSITSKDDLLTLQGPVLLEIGELRAFASAAEETGKSFLTITTDAFRAPYERSVKEHPRRCIFIGTTDKDQFLTDHDNRRFLPVRVRKRSYMTEADALELWHEAALRYLAGEKWWLSASQVRLQQAETARVRNGDVWEDTLREILADIAEITTRDALKKCSPDSKYSLADQHRVARIMRALGYTHKQRKGGGRYWRKYVRE